MNGKVTENTHLYNEYLNQIFLFAIDLCLFFVVNTKELDNEFQHLGLNDINHNNFDTVALTVFKHQAEQCSVYREFLRVMKIDVLSVKKVEDIPFLPISFFKNLEVICDRESPEVTFKSSGTTDSGRSKHHVSDLDLYRQSFNSTFELFYSKPSDYCILGLLPSYIEQGDSSLVYMVDHLIKRSNHEKSGFYLDDYAKLFALLQDLKSKGTKTILFGVTYALLDMAEQFPIDFEDLIIIETGGMKGRRKEIIRNELHEILSNSFATENIHSEYGMTELLSQAYSFSDEVFHAPPWMKVKITDLNDPNADCRFGKTGRINVIDLANINSCSFIATNDLGVSNQNGTFKVLGRVDHSDIRGCSLLTL